MFQMRVSRLLSLAALVALMFMAIPLGATAQNGDGANAAIDCKHGGWKTLRDATGIPFPNQGQCVRFAVQGGDFYEEPVAPTLAIAGGVTTHDGSVSGTGFTPGAEVMELVWESEPYGLDGSYLVSVGNLSSFIPDAIDGNGSFSSTGFLHWCNPVMELWIQWDLTEWTLTVTDSTGFSYSQKFDMTSHCGLS